MDERWGDAKPIETLYQGYTFRSRLEARWARFLDALKIRWDYEPEGFDLNGLYYLPDFWLPSLNCWLEIKPTNPIGIESEKAERLAKASGKPVYVFYGDLRPETTMAELFDTAGWDDRHRWCECPTCGHIGIGFEGYADRIGCGCNEDVPNPQSPRLVAAYLLARTTRFGT